MPNKPKKVIVLGLDALIAPRLYKYVRENRLPTIASIINNGVWARNCMVPLPTITCSNWASIATGAWPSTVGITDMNVHVPGEPLDKTHAGHFSHDVKAEFVWNAIERAGKKSIVLTYPGTWPPKINGWQVGGSAVHINQWSYPALHYDANGKWHDFEPEMVESFKKLGLVIMPPGFYWTSLSYERLFSTVNVKSMVEGKKEHPFRTKAIDLITLKEANGWSNLPPLKKALEGELVFRPSGGVYPMKRPAWQMLVIDRTGEGFDTVILSDSKDYTSRFAEIKVCQWSPVIKKEFETSHGIKKAAFALKLIALSRDASDLSIYHSPICGLDGWSYPETLSKELDNARGLAYPQSPFDGWDSGWFDLETSLEVMEMERQWHSDVGTYLLKNKPWDFFITHYHLPDAAWHAISDRMDPALNKNPDDIKKYQEVELEVYKDCDRLAADLFACADPEKTLFAIISDHGAKAAKGPYPDTNVALEKAGLLVRGKDGSIDWSKTRAISQRVTYVYVNLKGRDPDGIVDPSDYHKVQEEVIEALMSYVEPTLSKKPFMFALRKEDARYMNFYGDYVGDVVYALNDEWGPQHGPFLSSSGWGLGSVQGTFIMSGPGIKKGVELDRPVWSLDLIPTICHATGWPMPRQAEGAIIHQALENP